MHFLSQIKDPKEAAECLSEVKVFDEEVKILLDEGHIDIALEMLCRASQFERVIVEFEVYATKRGYQISATEESIAQWAMNY